MKSFEAAAAPPLPPPPTTISLFYHTCEHASLPSPPLHLPTPTPKHFAVSVDFETQELNGVIVLHPFGLQDGGGRREEGG